MAKNLAWEAPETEQKRSTDWWGEARALFWLILAVLGVHSFIAKPFYIPSESMMPSLLVGDRLVVSKYPYGYSYVSPTFNVLPFMKGRLFGSLPERGDIVITTPIDGRTDYIKRVIGLPGETIEMHGGIVYLNGQPIKRQHMGMRDFPVDENAQCDSRYYPGALEEGADGKLVCRLPIVRETLPNGKSYDTIDLGPSRADNFAPLVIPADHLFLMGDNRDNSSDSRMSLAQGGLGGPVPVENIGGRAEFITFSLNGSSGINPVSWFQALRPGRAGTSLHPDKQVE